MIFRRSPASSSFVLAAARLRALQLDPWPRGGKDRAAARKIQKNSQPSSAAPVVTGLDPYALLTTMALMGADVSARIGPPDGQAINGRLVMRTMTASVSSPWRIRRLLALLKDSVDLHL